MDRFRTVIHIENSVDDIMRLPCVKGCEKIAMDGTYQFTFHPLCMAHPFRFAKAQTGDRLCEDYNGKWHVLRNGKEMFV